MYKKFSQLSFVIGLFFLIVSVILFVNALLMEANTGLSLHTAIVFFAFGIIMILIKSKKDD